VRRTCRRVEIRPLDGAPDDHGHLPHVAVVDHPVGGERVPSLVFPEVLEGRHGLCLKGSPEALVAVEVRGGEVTTADWPA
jgi:hypothetical protein